MSAMIAVLRPFDQSTLEQMRQVDPIVQRYRALFALFDWSAIDPPRKRGPGNPGHPSSAYLKALLVRIGEHLLSTPRWRAYLLDHPLLVLELGFRPHIDTRQPYGFDVAKTVPCIRHLNHILRSLDVRLLADLLAQTVQAEHSAIPGLGETVAFDVKHIYANVKENNPRQYVKERYHKDRQPKGDPDCKLGVKRSTNKEQPDGSTKEVKEYLWGYGSGIATAIIPDYGQVVFADFTQTFNENDITYFVSLYIQTVATLGFFPRHITADAAFDAWYIYQLVVHRGGMAAIALNQHGHPECQRAPDGVPLCPKGLRMHPTYQFSHTYGYRAQRFRCPLLFPQATGETCDHEQFSKGKGCVKDLNWEAGAQMRVTLNRDGPLYRVIYNQRTSAERINSQAKDLGIERPKARNLRSIRRLNTLTYITINLKTLQRARAINASLLTPKLGKVA